MPSSWIRRATGWLDERLGWTAPTAGLSIPGGARWRYSTGAVLIYLFVVELLTGLFLMAAYAPSTRTAWESVFYIEHVMTAGSAVRGIHHYATHAMIVVAVLHLGVQVFDAAYRRPREVAWWLTLGLVGLLVVFSQSGYLLPWDQRSLVATGIATRIAGAAPGVGPYLESLARGGSGFGNATLTRFYTLHIGVLPLLFLLLGWARLKLQRLHGYAGQPDAKTRSHWWPDQAFRDAIAVAVTLGVVLTLALLLKAPLGPPADETVPFDAARPEWWFLPIFRLLRVDGVSELVAGHLLPGAVFATLAVLPFVPNRRGLRWIGPAAFGLIVLAGVGIGGLALYEDFAADDTHGRAFRASLADAETDAERAVVLAGSGIPPEGAAVMLQTDAKTQGSRLFAQFCSSCHPYNGGDGRGHDRTELASAPDLGLFGTRHWIRENLLHYRDQFAALANVEGEWQEPAEAILDGDMAYWSDENGPLLAAAEDDLAALVEYVAFQSGRDDLAPYDAAILDRGKSVIVDGELSTGEAIETCLDCHALVDRATEEVLLAEEDGYAPPLTGYGGSEWVRRMIADPAEHYGDPNAMPGFESQLSDEQIGYLAEWLTSNWSVPRKGLPAN